MKHPNCLLLQVLYFILVLVLTAYAGFLAFANLFFIGCRAAATCRAEGQTLILTPTATLSAVRVVHRDRQLHKILKVALGQNLGYLANYNNYFAEVILQIYTLC